MTLLSRRTFLGAAALVVSGPRLPLRAQPTTLDEFVELSERLLGRTTLDRELAQVYLNALLADKDSASVLAYLVGTNNNPTPEMRSLAATIVEWWYTGVYQINGKDRLATHTGALMWSSLGMPAPGTCAGAFGAWSKPPA